MRRLIALLKQEYGLLALIFACAGLNQLMLLGEPQLLRLIIDRYALRAATLSSAAFATGTGSLIGLSVLLALIARLSRSYQTYWSGVASQRVASRLYAELVGQAIQAMPDSVGDGASGERLQRLQQARASVQRLITQLAVPFSAALALLVVMVYAFTIHWALGLTLALMAPLLAAILIPVSVPITRQQRDVARAVAALSGATTERFRNAELLRGLGVEQEEASRLDDRAGQVLALEMRRLTLERRYRFIEGTVLNAARAVLLLIALWLLRQGSLTPGQLVTMVLYSASVFTPLSQLGEMIMAVRETGDSVAAASPAGAAAPRAASVNGEPARIRTIALAGASFRYPGAAAFAVEGANLELRAGRLIALVGGSGAGKSTVVKLLTGVHRPDAGQILVNGEPVDLGPANQKRIGLVTQDAQLFAGTIRENLLLARAGATDAECLTALSEAAAGGMLDRAGGALDLPIGEGGRGLSGGERQRLAIARALLRDPDVLILDEATSMLDLLTEREILDTVGRLTTASGTGRATLIVSHRLWIAAAADHVYVMADGRIIDEGPHDALCSRPGLYADLWREHDADRSAGGGIGRQ